MHIGALLFASLISAASPGAPTLSDIVALGATAAPPAPPPVAAPAAPGGGTAVPGAPTTTATGEARPALSAYVRGGSDLTAPLKAMVFVALIIGGLFLYLRRKQQGNNPQRTGMRVINRVSLGRNRELLMVEAGNSVMLLATSDKGVSLIRDQVDVTRPAVEASAPAPQKSSWLDHLSNALHGRVPTLDEQLDGPDTLAASAPAQTSAEDAEIRRKILSAMEKARGARAA